MLTVFRDIKESITMDFLEKRAFVNNASSYKLLRKNSPYLLNDLHIDCWLVGWVYGISTLEGYLMPNPFLCK